MNLNKARLTVKSIQSHQEASPYQKGKALEILRILDNPEATQKELSYSFGVLQTIVLDLINKECLSREGYRGHRG